jgi:membrane fusion protein (multidrug efflux system)/multidrug efflux system membrane fusion protein/cobalt-zinc-cadmium efflux system membrane fusion protein
MNRSILLLIFLFPLLLLYPACERSNGKPEANTEKIPVEVSRVSLGELSQSLQYNGDICAEYEVKVFSKIPDRIERFYVEEGEFIKKGSPVAKVLAITIEQAVRQAEAGLIATRAQEANLKLEYDRANRLYKENAMSQQQYESIKTQYESLQAQVQQAEAGLLSMKSQMNDATITAPISGIIGKKYYENGDMAQPVTPLVKIVKMDRVKVKFDVTEEDLGKLSVDQSAKISVKAYPDKFFTGQVHKISPILDPMTRMAEVEVLVENKESLLKPGMYAKVEVTTGTIKDVVVIPRFCAIENTSLRNIEGEDQVVRNYYVFVVDSNRAIQKKLDILYANHRWLAVESGLKVGDQLVVAGQNNLRDGLGVAISNVEEVQP